MIMSKLFNRFSQNSGKVAYGSWKKPLDFSGNLGVDLVQDFFYGIYTIWATAILQVDGYV